MSSSAGFMLRSLGMILTFFALAGVAAAPLGTQFTYQGQLQDAGQSAAGLYDIQ